MSACANCYQYIPEQNPREWRGNEVELFDVGHWWNEEWGRVYVCSKKCRDELKHRVENGTWMLWRHIADYPQPKTGPSFAVESVK